VLNDERFEMLMSRAVHSVSSLCYPTFQLFTRLMIIASL